MDRTIMDYDTVSSADDMFVSNTDEAGATVTEQEIPGEAKKEAVSSMIALTNGLENPEVNDIRFFTPNGIPKPCRV